MDQRHKAETFAALHIKGDPLVLYNIWDAGSARCIAAAGAKALATGSWSVAAAQGFADGQEMPLSQLVDIARSIVAVSELPVTVDFEGGFAEQPEDVALNAARIIDIGVVGINFEDQVLGGTGVHPLAEQVARIRAIREVADQRGMPLFINARTDLFLQENDPQRHAGLYDQVIERANAFAEAGASGFFVPGLADKSLIERLCAEVTLPVNIMMRPGGPSLDELAALGVSRISYGPIPYREMIRRLGEEAQAIYRRG